MLIITVSAAALRWVSEAKGWEGMSFCGVRQHQTFLYRVKNHKIVLLVLNRFQLRSTNALSAVC